MKSRTSFSYRKFLLIALLLAALFFAWLYREPLWEFLVVLTDQQAVTAYVQQLGPLGPVVYFLLLISQVFVAIIPGHALMMAGGYVFGAVWAILLTAVSTILGSQVAFWIARRYGRPIIYRLAKPTAIEHWSRLSDKQGALFFFFTFVLPFVPSDLMCYVAGLGNISPGRFFLANFSGRLLIAIELTLFGAFGFRPPWQFNVLVLVVMGILFIAWMIYKRRGRLSRADPTTLKK